MLARGIRSYHRPGGLEEALDLARQGMVPLAGGTRLLASRDEIANVLDLSALGFGGITVDDGDLVLGALVTLQDVVDSALAYPATTGLLPEACLAQTSSRMRREMATVGGESIHGALDSEVVAALLALNAVYVIALPNGLLESPGLRFLRNPTEDLAGGGLLQSLMIPGAPDGTALERVAVVPSAPSILAVAVTISFSGENCARARIALTGLETRPARVLEAEARIEGTPGDERAIERCLEQVVTRAPFRDDAHASAAYRKALAHTLTGRALRRALARARAKAPVLAPRSRTRRPPRPPMTPLPYFTSGRVDFWVNGAPSHANVDARTTLLDMLRREGFRGTKHGCETGDCGACAVLLDGRPVNSCLTLALRASGRSLTTIEGLGAPEALHPVQQAFVDAGAVGCGYCTPAMELCAKALLDAIPDPNEADVREALGGCLCRCTGYEKQVAAVLEAARVGSRNGSR
jgi:aerobic-type carbon monoxide dehydrogenase small subunit (CoxS/CutS family)/CO/xanthine dehydrogenase FAD-binding subunit